MKKDPHRLVVFVLGLAFALEQIRTIIPKIPFGSRVYLFSFETKRAQQYFMNIMSRISGMNISDPWALYTAKEYNREPLVERDECWDEIRSCFSVSKQELGEGLFDFSLLLPDAREIGREVYNRHIGAFQQIAANLYNSKPFSDPEYDFGFIFLKKED